MRTISEVERDITVTFDIESRVRDSMQRLIADAFMGMRTPLFREIQRIEALKTKEGADYDLFAEACARHSQQQVDNESDRTSDGIKPGQDIL